MASTTTEPRMKGYQCGKCSRLFGSAKTLKKTSCYACGHHFCHHFHNNHFRCHIHNSHLRCNSQLRDPVQWQKSRGGKWKGKVIEKVGLSPKRLANSIIDPARTMFSTTEFGATQKTFSSLDQCLKMDLVMYGRICYENLSWSGK